MRLAEAVRDRNGDLTRKATVRKQAERATETGPGSHGQGVSRPALRGALPERRHTLSTPVRY